MSGSQELVVFLVNRELKGMLVVSKERVVTIGQIRKRTAQIETVLNGRSVIHGSEVVFLDSKDHQLFENLISHHKLFACARDISVVVQDSHAGVASDLHLNGNITGEISMDLCFLRGMHSRVKSGGSVVKALVPDLINHIII